MFKPETITMISKALDRFGIHHPMLKAGILAVVSTEGSFDPTSEMSYAKTPNDRLRMIFGDLLKKYDESSLLTLKNDNVKFFDVIYGGKNGNIAAGDGFKYRGRGFNQITFRNWYEKIGTKIGIDLITNPDKMNIPEVAADALAAYFSISLTTMQSTVIKWLDVKSLDDKSKLQIALLIAFQMNAGAGMSLTIKQYDDEHAKQILVLDELYQSVKL